MIVFNGYRKMLSQYGEQVEKAAMALCLSGISEWDLFVFSQSKTHFISLLYLSFCPLVLLD